MASVRRYSPQLLSKLKLKYEASEFSAQFVNGYWRTSKLSLRQQGDLRKACLVHKVDPSVLGIPALPPKKVLRAKPPKGHKADRTKPDRIAKIQAALDNMPNTIAQWKAAKQAEKAKAKPLLPF
ncbi:hypothetical protein IWQ60_008140 [Tieghemiomyces parasiticus]|uniref:Large ribosomal subunit protein mL59 domain-containing protein n=1 Tax=Tieghemiomyces parasiticus TaxID=78921 RepID=A0A9W8A309_9FUNG|nr:hypothetical protein IWQ60_008140 [Tieghemiomyces parasiticus]